MSKTISFLEKDGSRTCKTEEQDVFKDRVDVNRGVFLLKLEVEDSFLVWGEVDHEKVACHHHTDLGDPAIVFYKGCFDHLFL